MKRILALLLVISMSLCFAACGESEDKDNEKDKISCAESYDELIEHIEKFYGGEAEYYTTFDPKEYWDYFEEKYGEGSSEEFVQEIREKFEKNIGKNIEATVEVSKKRELSEKELSTLANAMHRRIEKIDPELVTKGYNFVFRFTQKGENGEKSKQRDVIAVEYDGYWYLTDYYENEDKAGFDILV